MRKYLYYIWLMSAALLVASCSKQEVSPDNGEKIAFYVKSQQAVTASSRALIEDTEYLLENGKDLPLWVTDEVGSVFSDKKVGYAANGVWRSETEWQEGKQYTFYAYIASPKVDYAGTTGVYVSNNGYTVYMQQPKSYSDDPGVWSDYLMSYRVSANGSNKGLVKLDMERVTACVELYMAKSESMGAVTVKSISFNDVKTYAKLGLTKHAVPGDSEGLYGMKNTWTVEPDDNSVTDYTRNTVSSLLNYADNRFDENFLQMKLLVIPQSLIDGPTLTIDYEVTENGKLVTYQSEFKLSDYSIGSWDRGHKIRYYIGIDTSIKLEGVVEPWKSMDYIESTLLPKN